MAAIEVVGKVTWVGSDARKQNNLPYDGMLGKRGCRRGMRTCLDSVTLTIVLSH